MAIDLIIPVYNPETNWTRAITETNVYLSDFNINWIFVNDGSFVDLNKDKSQIIQNISGAKWIDIPKNKGKGAALREGVRHCKGNYTIYTDVDLPYRVSDLTDLIYRLKSSDSDIVAGKRDNNYYLSIPKHRKTISLILRWFIRNILRWPIDDTQCGLKGFKAKHNDLFLKTVTTSYVIDIEFLYLSIKNRLKIDQINVSLRNPIEQSEIKLKIILRESINLLKVLLK